MSQHQDTSGLGRVTAPGQQRLGPCHSTRTPAAWAVSQHLDNSGLGRVIAPGHQRLGPCHSTMTPAGWAVSQHLDTSGLGRVIQHQDTSRNARATLKGGYIKRWLYAASLPGELSSATISSMPDSVHLPTNDDQSSGDDMGCPCGVAIQNGHTRSSFSLWNVFINEQLRVPVDPRAFK